MDGSKLNALFAEMTPDEIEFIPRGVDAWLRGGWMDVDEAVEWRRDYDASLQGFLRLRFPAEFALTQTSLPV